MKRNLKHKLKRYVRYNLLLPALTFIQRTLDPTWDEIFRLYVYSMFICYEVPILFLSDLTGGLKGNEVHFKCKDWNQIQKHKSMYAVYSIHEYVI